MTLRQLADAFPVIVINVTIALLAFAAVAIYQQRHSPPVELPVFAKPVCTDKPMIRRDPAYWWSADI
jgi:hypothetical protein